MRDGEGDDLAGAAGAQDLLGFVEGRPGGSDVVDQNNVFLFYKPRILFNVFYGKRSDNIF